MATYSVSEVGNGRSAKADWKKSEYTRHYIIQVDEPAKAEDLRNCITAVMNALIAEQGGATTTPRMPGEPYAYLNNISITPHGDEPVYFANVDYKTRDLDNPETYDEDTVAKVSWGFRTLNESLSRDINFYPILNSAQEAFNPPLEQEVYHPFVTITRNESADPIGWPYYEPFKSMEFIGAVNNDFVNIAGLECSPYNALMRNYSGELRYNGSTGAYYWKVTYEIEFCNVYYDAMGYIQDGGWIRYVLDCGTAYRDSNGNKQIFRVGGEPADVPGLLDGYGRKLGDFEAPVYLKYATRPEMSFLELGLGINYLLG